MARLLYALVALGLAYIRCVENADDLRPVTLESLMKIACIALRRKK